MEAQGMETRGWTLSTFVGCCIWILHGLGAAAAIPVTTEGPFAVGTASPTMAATEDPYTTAADAVIAESILAGSPSSPSFPPGTDSDVLVTAASEYISTVPTLANVTKPPTMSQDIERGLGAPTTATTTTATVSAPYPAVTPEAEMNGTGATPETALEITPLLADVKEDILAAVTREGADPDPTAGDVFFPNTPPLEATWGAQTTAGSPVGAGVTALLSQGLTTATGAVQEDTVQPVDIQSEPSATSSSSSPGAGLLPMTQQDGAVSGAMGITPLPAGGAALAAEESPSASVPGDAGNDVNGAFGTASSSHWLPESVTVSGTVGNPETSLLPNQAEQSPAASLVLGSGGDGQGAPAMSSDAPDSPLAAASVAPAVTEDIATSLLAPRVPTDAESGTNSPALASVLTTGDIGNTGLDEVSLQPATWQTSTGEQPLMPAAVLTSPTDTSSVPGAAYPPPGAGPGTLPAADDGAETPVSPGLGTAPGAPVSPSFGESKPWGTAAAASQGADGPSSGLNSSLDDLSAASLVSDGLAWPTAGGPPQGAEGAGDTTEAGGPGDASSYADTQSETSPSASSTQQDPTNTGELPAGGTGGLANAELSSPSFPGDGAEAGAAPELGQVSPPGPPPGSAGLEPKLLGAEGPWGLPGESPSTPGAAYPSLGAVAGPMSGAETPVSPDIGTAQGPAVSLGGETAWGTAVGAPQGPGLPGTDGPGTGLTSAWDAPSSASNGPAGPPSPALGNQLGANLDLPEEGLGAGMAEPMVGGEGSRIGAEPPVSSAAGSGMAAGMDQLPGTGSSSGPASPGDLVTASSILRGDGAEPIPAAAPAPHSLSPASPDRETVPELISVQETESVGDAAQAGNPSPYMDMSPSASSTQQDPTNAGELLAGGLSRGEIPVSPDLSAAQGPAVSPSTGGSQPWDTAAGAPQGPGLPGADGPGTGLTSAWDAPSSASNGPAGPPSPALGVQLGTNPEMPAVETHGPGTTEPVLGGEGSSTRSEPSLISAAGSGTAAGLDQLAGAGSLSGPSFPNGVVAESSVSDPASPSALGEVGGAPGAPQPSLGAGPGVRPAAEKGASEASADEGFPGLFQASAGGEPAGSGDPGREMAAVQQSVSSSPSMEGSSSPGTTGDAANGASLPGTGGAGGGSSTGLGAAVPEEPSVSYPGIQSGVNLGLSDPKLSQASVVELPGGASVNRGPLPGASQGEGTGAIVQSASGALAPSALTSPQEIQPLVPVAVDGSGASDGTATSAASLLLPGHELSSGMAPNGDPHSDPSTQSGSRPLVPGAPGRVAGDAGGTQTWSLEDKVASGMPVSLGEASPHAPTAEGVSTSPRLSTSLSARESIAGSSAGGRGELGAAVLGDPALLLTPLQLGNPSDPSRDADSPVPGEATADLSRAMAGQEDMAQLLPGTAGAMAAVETPTRFLPWGTPGLSGLRPAGVAASSPDSKVPGPGPASSLSPAALQPLLGSKATASLANGAPAASGSGLPTAFPGQGGAQGGSPATTRSVVSCSPAPASPAKPAPLPGVRNMLPKSGAGTVTSRASSPVFPALPGRPAATPTPLPGPAVAAVPLYGYGARENDQEYVERRVDFNSPLFKPETGFPFGRTLRDSLYFTDNGQIIFPASDNSIFTYPNPPPNGFSGREKVPMIAVFWDNADFSKGVGTTFYQEFPTLNTAKPPFVRDVEAKVRQYLRSSYSAAWTLKITWEKAPAYGAQTDTQKTITYQAILTTDGYRSYVLMLYQEGGMRWDYTRLAATNVLIGYTSGDGFYRNDDLTRRPPAAKYRPDLFKGYNTDVRGLWIYKLESRVDVNYRLKCLAWMWREPEPQAWNQGLPTCPCSLKQGQQDPRFKSSWGGWRAARFSMLYSASPNQHGAGIRCLYNGQNQLLQGRQERYWRSSRRASSYRDQELKMHDWCCNQAGSTQLCDLYGKKRPKIGCDGYQSAGTAGSSEEEHDSEEQRDEDDK